MRGLVAHGDGSAAVPSADANNPPMTSSGPTSPNLSQRGFAAVVAFAGGTRASPRVRCGKALRPGASKVMYWVPRACYPLLGANHHPLRTGQPLSMDVAKPRLMHPGAAVGRSKVEPTVGLDQHREAH